MRFFKYLFFKYYNWAIKVGNSDIPATISVLCISFSILLYFIDIVMAYYFFISHNTNFSSMNMYVFAVVYLLSFVLLYFILVAKGKAKQIIETHEEEWKGKKHFGAILFPIMAYVAFGIEIYVKMLTNQGKP